MIERARQAAKRLKSALGEKALEVYEDGRLLMGERLWDLMRCVDYLRSLPTVDSKRIGCAGLSLGALEPKDGTLLLGCASKDEGAGSAGRGAGLSDVV